MPALPRKTQQIFGSGLTPAGNVAIWGSLQAGTPAFSDDPDQIQSANFLQGLNGAVVGNRSPAMEDLNGLFLLVTKQLAYLFQSGLPEWDPGTAYFVDGFCRKAGVVYISIIDDNLNNDPASDTNSWVTLKSTLAPTGSTARAFVNFNGNTGAILSSFNVASIVRTAAGCYTIDFAEALVDANYAVVATCGAGNGGSRSVPAGNNNHVSRDAITTAAQFSIWIPKPDQLFGEDADLVSVVVF